MKFLSLTLLIGAAIASGCTTTNNGNNANLRGTNTNTGYVTNSDTNAKPAMPTNATNISPGSMSDKKDMGNTGNMSNSKTNSNMSPKMNTNSTPRPANKP